MYSNYLTVQAPNNFTPQRLDAQLVVAPEPAPPAVPPKPFKDTNVFDAVDGHAVKVGLIHINYILIFLVVSG